MCPYPFEQFSFVTITGMYARRAFPGFVGYTPQYLEKEFTTTGHDAHETSLLWWGYTTRGEGPGSFQWTEGFGDYVEILYDETYQKPIPKIFERFRAEYLALPSEQDVPYTDLRGNTPQKIVHGKYPWLMHLVRYTVGDSAFISGLRLLFKRYRQRTFSMDEFIATLEEGSGQSLQWWREEWLERKGVPDIAFSSRVEKLDDSSRVVCDIEQRGNVYHLPLEIGIRTSRGLQVEKVQLVDQQMMFTFDVREEPSEIVLDPERWILMKVTRTY
jgi:aminopeptidase N